DRPFTEDAPFQQDEGDGRGRSLRNHPGERAVQREGRDEFQTQPVRPDSDNECESVHHDVTALLPDTSEVPGGKREATVQEVSSRGAEHEAARTCDVTPEDDVHSERAQELVGAEIDDAAAPADQHETQYLAEDPW